MTFRLSLLLLGLASVWVGGCAQGPPVLESVTPAVGEVEVGTLQSVAFRFDRRVRADDVVVQWNVHGENGRIGAQAQADGRVIRVTPFEPLAHSTRFRVTLHGVTSPSGEVAAPVSTDFRTWVRSNVEWWGVDPDGEPYTGGWCDLDARGLIDVCRWVQPGPDDRLGTADDQAGHIYCRMEWDGYRLLARSYLYGAPEGGTWWHNVYRYGEDDRLATEEYGPAASSSPEGQELEHREIYSWSADGFLASTRLVSAGPDGMMETDDDWQGVWESTSDGYGAAVATVGWAPGPDGALGTADDVVTGETLRDLDEHGRVWFESRWSGGELEYETFFTYDAEGRRERQLTRGGDGSVLAWVEYVWGAKGLAQLTAWHDGGDGEQNTADDYRTQHDLLRYDAEGRLLESWGPVAGPDGVWGTPDDGEALVKAYGPETR